MDEVREYVQHAPDVHADAEREEPRVAADRVRRDANVAVERRVAAKPEVVVVLHHFYTQTVSDDG